jgi:hypothetical protein
MLIARLIIAIRQVPFIPCHSFVFDFIDAWSTMVVTTVYSWGVIIGLWDKKISLTA